MGRRTADKDGQPVKKKKKGRGMSGLFACLGGCGGLAPRDELDDITELDFRHYSLTEVPPDVFACEVTLETLYLDSNQLTELPRELFHCHGLQSLTISDNELKQLPNAVAALTALRTLDISKNNLSSIPDSMKSCRELCSVDASVNPLCRLPEGFTQLIALKQLFLNDTFLEYLPANFGRLANLEVLELRENQLNTLPKSLARLTKLRRLDIGSNEFSQLPEVVGSLAGLSELWFDGNRVRCLDPFIGQLTELSYMDGSNNRIDTLPDEISNCRNLSDLHLSNNNLETLPESFCDCSNLQVLKLDDNALTALPSNLGNLSQLTELVVTQNYLEELPASVGLLRNLHTLHADHNILVKVPPELGSCSSLAVLTLASNRLIELPPELGQLSCLKVLNVWDNCIRNLPVSFSKLKLMALWLAENQAKPSVQLQTETDPRTGQKVLTCYMLPQQPGLRRDEPKDEVPFPAETWDERHRARSLIKFAFDDTELKTGAKLSRAPTPYPKELRALAKHARNLTTGSRNSTASDDGGTEGSRRNSRVDEPVTEVRGRREEASSSRLLEESVDVVQPEYLASSEAVAAADSQPVVRQATKTCPERLVVAYSNQQSEEDVAEPPEPPLPPPPVAEGSKAVSATSMEPLIAGCAAVSKDSLSEDETPSDLLAEALAVADHVSGTASHTKVGAEDSGERSSTDSGYGRPSHVTSSLNDVSDRSSDLASPVSSLPPETPNSQSQGGREGSVCSTPTPRQSPTGEQCAAAFTTSEKLLQPRSQPRPGSLALASLADAGVLSEHLLRPGSVAAPCNTLGIPPAPVRALSAATGLNQSVPHGYQIGEFLNSAMAQETGYREGHSLGLRSPSSASPNIPLPAANLTAYEPHSKQHISHIPAPKFSRIPLGKQNSIEHRTESKPYGTQIPAKSAVADKYFNPEGSSRIPSFSSAGRSSAIQGIKSNSMLNGSAGTIAAKESSICPPSNLHFKAANKDSRHASLSASSEANSHISNCSESLETTSRIPQLGYARSNSSLNNSAKDTRISSLPSTGSFGKGGISASMPSAVKTASSRIPTSPFSPNSSLDYGAQHHPCDQGRSVVKPSCRELLSPSQFVSNHSKLPSSSLSPINHAINTSGLPPMPEQESRKQQQYSNKCSSKIPLFGPGAPAGAVSTAPAAAASGPRSGLPVRAPPQLPWMFGHHQNARVFPVIIEKNPGPGFTISELTHPEKIDGELVTCIDKEALDCLVANNGDIVNLLVSRVS